MKTVTVSNMEKVDVTSYLEGDVFISEKKIGVLHNGKIETLVMESDLKKTYVKKSDVVKMIDEAMKKVIK